MLDDKIASGINLRLVSLLQAVCRRVLIFDVLVHLNPVPVGIDAGSDFLCQRFGVCEGFEASLEHGIGVSFEEPAMLDYVVVVVFSEHPAAVRARQQIILQKRQIRLKCTLRFVHRLAYCITVAACLLDEDRPALTERTHKSFRLESRFLGKPLRRTTEIAPSGTFLTFANEMEGTVTGIEMWGAYQALPRWRLTAGYMATRTRLHLKPGSNDATATSAAGMAPSNSWQLRSASSIAEDGELDVAVRHVAALSTPDVPSYTAIDVRFGWRFRPNLELSLTGQNLLGADHGEYGPILTRARIPRAILVGVRWQLP